MNTFSFFSLDITKSKMQFCTSLEESCSPSLNSHCIRQLRWVETVWTAGEWRLGALWSVYILYLNVFWFQFYWIISVWLLLVDRPDDWVFIHEKFCVSVGCMLFYVIFQETNVGLYFINQETIGLGVFSIPPWSPCETLSCLDHSFHLLNLHAWTMTNNTKVK